MKRLCFVCGNAIAGRPVCLASPGSRDARREYPEGLYRHERCAPGTARWLDTKQPRRWRRYWQEGGAR